MKLQSSRALVALVMAAMVSLMLATPSGATVNTYHMTMEEGSIDVGDTMFETPGVGIEECPGDTTIEGTINTTTNTVTGTLEIYSPFVSPLDDLDYVLEATGTANTHGTYNPGDGTFSGLHFSTINFEIWSLETEEGLCTTVERECVGMATLTMSGGLYTGATLPLGTGEEIYANGVGSITTVPFSTCTFIWWLLLNGADLAIGPNTTIGTSPGAVFVQT